MLRQIEWGVQNGHITKDKLFPVINLFLGKFCFCLRASNKELI